MNYHLKYGFFDATDEKEMIVLIAGKLSRMLEDGLSPLDACRALAILCRNRDYSRALENVIGLLQTGRTLAEAFTAQNVAGKPELFPQEFLRCLKADNQIEFTRHQSAPRQTAETTISYLLDAFVIKNGRAAKLE